MSANAPTPPATREPTGGSVVSQGVRWLKSLPGPARFWLLQYVIAVSAFPRVLLKLPGAARLLVLLRCGIAMADWVA